MAKIIAEKWHKVDWSKSVDEIALEMGVKRQTVITYRSKLGKSESRNTNIDWDNVDWSLNSTAIAKKHGINIQTVYCKRVALGLSHTAKDRAPRKDIGTKKPQCAPHNKIGQQIATQAAKESHLSGRFESNVRAIDWAIISPDGKTYRFKNLFEFVRQNTHLFNALDVAWKTSKGRVAEYCNATAGIQNLKADKAQSWKGWTIVKQKE